MSIPNDTQIIFGNWIGLLLKECTTKPKSLKPKFSCKSQQIKIKTQSEWVYVYVCACVISYFDLLLIQLNAKQHSRNTTHSIHFPCGYHNYFDFVLLVLVGLCTSKNFLFAIFHLSCPLSIYPNLFITRYCWTVCIRSASNHR